VVEIDPEHNKVVLGREEELQRKGMWVQGLNMGKYATLTEPMEVVAKIRYKDSGQMATIRQHGNRMEVIFNSTVKAIAPGQSAVFYEGNDVVAGGWIQSAFDVIHA